MINLGYECFTCEKRGDFTICQECFEEGDHEGHHFKVEKPNDGWTCDCGKEDLMKK